MKKKCKDFYLKNQKVLKRIFYIFCILFVIGTALFLRSCILKRIEIAQLPRLSSIEITDGYEVDFKSDVFEYTVKIPDGHPIVPDVKGYTSQTIEKSEYQAYIPFDEKSGTASIVLNDGTHKSTYEITFEKSPEMGFSLQYDDRYTFTPDYTLKEGEEFFFDLGENSLNLEVNGSTGEIYIVDVNSTPSTVNAYVGEEIVDTFTVDKTTKAPLELFIIAGQGNASGEGGKAEESIKSLPGTTYSAELSSTEMGSFVNGRAGFSAALSNEWYNQTGEKVFSIHTAVSNVSVSEWGNDGEIKKLAEARVKYFEDKLSSENSKYLIDHIYYFWCHGEWDISKGMTSEEYMKYYLEMHNSFKESLNIEMGGIIPVRSVSGDVDTSYDLTPVGAAQYALHNTINNIYITTRFPEQASIEDGYIADGNLYYTQKGYNFLGVDVAKNFLKIFSVESDKKAESIAVYSSSLSKTYKDGENIEIKTGTTLQTMAIASPIFIKDKQIKVEYSNEILTYTATGLISISADQKQDLVTDIIFSCGDIKHTIHLTSKFELTDKKLQSTEFEYGFDDLFDKNNGGELLLSERSKEDGYYLEDGKIVLKEKNTDFILPQDIVLNDQNSWNVEWSGKINGNSILSGGDFTNAGYIFLAPYNDSLGYSVRIVFDSGEAVYLQYGDTKSTVGEYGSWKISFDSESKMLYFSKDGEIISETNTPEKYTLTLTNLFGRYANEANGYCADGEFDYVKVKIGQ